MQIHLADTLTSDIIARFRMCGTFVDDAMYRAYRNVLMAYDDDHGESVVRQMLKDHRVPVTDAELDRMLMPPAPISPQRPTGPVSDPAIGRKLMREEWVRSSCERNGITEEEFFRRDEEKARDGKWEPLRRQWARVDRIIAERKKRGLPVDESGLTAMAPVGPDPFADDEPAERIVKPVERKEDQAERLRRERIIAEAAAKARAAMSDPLSDFFKETAA